MTALCTKCSIIQWSFVSNSIQISQIIAFVKVLNWYSMVLAMERSQMAHSDIYARQVSSDKSICQMHECKCQTHYCSCINNGGNLEI